MATRNEHTGDLIASKPQSKQFADNYDAIFRQPDDQPSNANYLLNDDEMGFNTK